MIRRIVICLLSIVLLPLSLKAKPQPKEVAALSVEQEAQFKYYWYAAKRATEERRYADAYALLEFCRMLKPTDGRTLVFLGMLYDGIGAKEKANEAYRQAFEADPGDYWYRYSDVLLSLHTMEGFNAAIKVLEQAHKAQTSKGGKADEDMLDQLARMYMSAGEWKKAIVILDEIDTQKGYDAYSAANRFRAYMIGGKTKLALGEIDKYLELDPTNVQFMLFRMEVLERTNAKQKDLYAQYEKILEMDPLNLGVLNNYAYHLATHNGDLQKAERMSAITLREEPNNPVYLDTYGWILHLKGEDELALFYLNRALMNRTESTREEIIKHINQIKK